MNLANVQNAGGRFIRKLYVFPANTRSVHLKLFQVFFWTVWWMTVAFCDTLITLKYQQGDVAGNFEERF